jgi:hypothetical protein
MSELVASGPGGRPLWTKMIMTMLLTLVIGPPVGTILVLLANAVGWAPDAIVKVMEGRSILAVLFEGYVAGGVPALICGLSFAISGWLSSRLSIWVPILTALILACFFKIIFYGISGGGTVFSVIIHLVPALATWWLVKAYWQEAEV